MEKQREYLTILDLLGKVIEANRGVQQADEQLLEAELLAIKFFHHSASAFYLSRSTVINDFPSVRIHFLDASSINVLARAAVESFLTFHYIFGANVSKEERGFRFYSWQLGGLKDRQRYLTSLEILTQEAKKVLANEQKCIQNYEQILRNNRVFVSLSVKEQRRILKGNWKTQSWREIALDAKLSETHAEHFYSYLCGYAHSSSLSTLQLSQANTVQGQEVLFAGTMGLIRIAMSNFIFEYCSLFPNSLSELNKNTKAKALAEDWVLIGQEV